MSHFVALVFGKDHEALLEPFDENTAVDPYWAVEYEAPVPTDNYYLKEAISRGDLTESSTLDELVAWMNEYARSEEHGQTYRATPEGKIERLTTYNPQSKWDWWSVGGRWSDHLLLKSGKRADQALKSEVDWDAMEADARASAAEDFDKFAAATAGMPTPEKWTEEYVESKGGLDLARLAYNAQPVVQEFKKLGYWLEEVHEEFLLDLPEAERREKYIERRALGARVPARAIITPDGEWHERGTMGWFGMSFGDVPVAEWAKTKADLLASVPDDETVTVIDCHI